MKPSDEKETRRRYGYRQKNHSASIAIFFLFTHMQKEPRFGKAEIPTSSFHGFLVDDKMVDIGFIISREISALKYFHLECLDMIMLITTNLTKVAHLVLFTPTGSDSCRRGVLDLHLISFVKVSTK
jgi:hypothetical protein